jgi:hypothetical protein
MISAVLIFFLCLHQLSDTITTSAHVAQEHSTLGTKQFVTGMMIVFSATTMSKI